jgi:hypothetical protein
LSFAAKEIRGKGIDPHDRLPVLARQLVPQFAGYNVPVLPGPGGRGDLFESISLGPLFRLVVDDECDKDSQNEQARRVHFPTGRLFSAPGLP